ncbi:MAG: hypothetical protein ACT4OZ_11995 [Gemmatimonadota bacterium]
MYRLSLRIDGNISIEAFRDALASFLHLLREVEASVAGERAVRWTLENLHHGSPATMTWKGEARQPKRTKKVVVKPDYAPIIGRALLSGVRRLEHGEGRPADFNDEALDATMTLARVTKRPGISALSIIGDNGREQPQELVSLDVTERTAEAVKEIIAPRYTAPGAIDGMLQAINSRGGLYFVVYDAIFGSRVRCDIPDTLKAKALAAFDNRVLVSGMVSRDAEGHPRHIRVQDIEKISTDLPQSIRGLDPDFTGNVSSAEYLKRGWSSSRNG